MHIAGHVPRSHLRTTNGGEDFEIINMVSYLPIRREKIDRIRLYIYIYSHEERQSNEHTNRDKCCTVTSELIRDPYLEKCAFSFFITVFDFVVRI